MPLRVSGKNVDIGESLRQHVNDRVRDALTKYFDGGYSGHVVVEKDGGRFRTETTLHLATGITLQATGVAHDPYPSVDTAVEHIEKRLRRYKRKLKDHHGARNAVGEPQFVESSYKVLEAIDDEEEVPADFHPLVVAEQTTKLKTLSVGQAVMEMDLQDTHVLVFRHAGHGGINVVYRRKDGNIGWVDPALGTAGTA